MKNIILVFFLFFTINIISQTDNVSNYDRIFLTGNVDKLFSFDSCKDVKVEGNLVLQCFNMELHKFVSSELLKDTYRGVTCSKGRYFVFLSYVIDEKGKFTNLSISMRGNSCEKLKEAIKQIMKNPPLVNPALKNGKKVKVEHTSAVSLRF